jgi:PKD repeat protein
MNNPRGLLWVLPLVATLSARLASAQGSYQYQFGVWPLWIYLFDYKQEPPSIRTPLVDTVWYNDTFYTKKHFEYSNWTIPICDSSGKLIAVTGEGGTILSIDLKRQIYEDTTGLFLAKAREGNKLYFYYDQDKTLYLRSFRYYLGPGATINRLVPESKWVYPDFFPPGEFFNSYWFKFQFYCGHDSIWCLMAHDSAMSVGAGYALGAYLYQFSETGLWEKPLALTLRFPPPPPHLRGYRAVCQSLGAIDSRRYLVNLVYRSNNPREGELRHSYLYLVRLKASGRELRSMRVIDSTYCSAEGLGMMARPITYAMAPGGRYLYTGRVVHRSRTINNHGIPEYKKYADLHQIDLFTGRRHRIIPSPNDTFPFGGFNHSNAHFDFKTAPNGQIYFTVKAYFDKPWQEDAFGSVAYPDKGPDSCRLHLAIRYYPFPNEQMGPEIKYQLAGEFPKLAKQSAHMRYRLSAGCGSGIRVESLGPDFFTTWKWYLLRPSDSAVVDSAQGPGARLVPARSGEYLVKGRARTNTGYTNWRWDYISYFVPPAAKILPPQGPVCQWVPQRFGLEWQADTAAPQGASWRWEFFLGDSMALTSHQKEPSMVFAKAGLYTVRLIHSNGYCTDTIPLGTPITVLPARTSGMWVSDTFACAPATIRLRSLVSFTADSVAFHWSDGQRQAGPHAQRELHRPKKYGVTHRVYFANGCVLTDSVLVHLAQGLPSQPPQAYHATHLESDSLLLVLPPNGWAARQVAVVSGAGGSPFTDTLYPPYGAYRLARPPYGGPYAFKLSGTDSCGEGTGTGPAVSTIWAQALNDNNHTLLVHWSPPALGSGTQSHGPYLIESHSDGSYRVLDETFADTLAKLPLQLAEGQEAGLSILLPVEREGLTTYLRSNTVGYEATSALYVPNAFSPNGDGVNDHFTVNGFGIKELHMDVFASTGQQLWAGQEPYATWNGMDQAGQPYPVGEYLVLIRYTTHTGMESATSLSITLLR